MKKAIIVCSIFVLSIIAVLIVFRQNKYQTSFYDVFDTYSQIDVYSNNKKLANQAMENVHNELIELNKLYDRYNNYDGINNIKTINDNAGLQPVKIDSELMELLEFSKEVYSDTDGSVNAAMGSVLEIWHSHREAAVENPENATLPNMDELKMASWNTDIDYLVLDKENSTAYLEDRRISLDVGAIAKGVAADRAIEVLKDSGIKSAMVNLGGNIAVIGAPKGKASWRIGVSNPRDNSQSSAVVSVKDASVVTSGDYQRYFEIDGMRYNHIIDKDTLMPANRYASVTVLADSSAKADMLSTALFILPEDKGDELAKRFNAKVCRIYSDGRIACDDIFETS